MSDAAVLEETKAKHVMPARSALRTFLGLPYSKELEDIDIAIAGIPFDLGVSNRPGTRLGPRHIRRFVKSGIADPDLDINIQESLKCIDYGDFALQSGYLEDSFEKITAQMKEILDSSVTPIIVGGDHSITFPELAAYYEKYGRMAMIHFDSHLDTSVNEEAKKDYYTHGSPFSWAIKRGYLDGSHVIQIGIRGGFDKEARMQFSKDHDIEFILARDLHRMSYDDIASHIRKKVGNMPVLVTFDIDFLDPAYAPGTGTPVVGGFSVQDAVQIMEKALIGLDIKGADLVEVMPYYDPGEVTANNAGTILQKLFSIISYNKIKLKETV